MSVSVNSKWFQLLKRMIRAAKFNYTPPKEGGSQPYKTCICSLVPLFEQNLYAKGFFSPPCMRWHNAGQCLPLLMTSAEGNFLRRVRSTWQVASCLCEILEQHPGWIWQFNNFRFAPQAKDGFLRQLHAFFAITISQEG